MSGSRAGRLLDRTDALQHAKERALEEAAEAAGDADAAEAATDADGEGGASLRAFLHRYYRHVSAEDLVGRSAEAVLGAPLSHRRLAETRPQGTATVRVTTADGESHSVVEIVSDDMPFLVDSVTSELSRHGRAIHLVVHPQLVVRRDVTGRLLAVCDATSVGDGPDDTDAADAVVESWMRIEIDREVDEEARATPDRRPRSGCCATYARPSRTGRR